MPITRATNLAGLGTIFDSLTDGGGLSVSGISTFTDLNITRVNITGVGTISNGSITNLTGTSSTITTLTSTNGSITNLTGTAATITTLRSTTGNFTTGNIVTGVTTNFTSTNATITNLTGTSTIQITGFANPSSGTGLELGHDGTNGIIQSFNRGTSAYKELLLSANSIQLSIAGGEAARIDSSRRLLLGTSTTSANGAPFQIVGSSEGMDVLRYGNNASSTNIVLYKTRGATNVHGIVSADDGLGQITFRGSDGTNYITGAHIKGEVDSTPGANDMPGRLVFSTTADGGSSPTERMRIGSSGAIQFGAALNFANVGGTITGSGGAINWIGVKDDGGNFVFQAMTAGTGSGNLLVGYSSSNGAYKLQVNSQIFATSATVATSDGRFKENVVTLGGCVDLVKALRPVSFTWKHQQDITRTDDEGKEVLVREGHNFPDGTQVGFIAQEVQGVLAEKPWLTSIIKENVRPAVTDPEGNDLAPKEEFLGIAEGNLIAVLTAALQEAIAKIETLEQRLTAAGID